MNKKHGKKDGRNNDAYILYKLIVAKPGEKN